MRAETFLRLYRVLEGLLEEKYGKASSVVMEYLSSPDSEPVRVKLNLCREMRNILTHNACEDGTPVCEPSPEIVRNLYAIIEYVQKPRPAIAAATAADALLTADMEDFLLPILRDMSAKGFSNVPVLQDGCVCGVCSASRLMAYIASGGYVNDQTRIRHLKQYISLTRENAGRYIFMASDVSCNAAAAEFEAHSARNSRLMAIFITDNGEPDRPLLGMLTPWDVLGKDD